MNISKENFSLSLGISLDHQMRQKPVRNAPDLDPSEIVSTYRLFSFKERALLVLGNNPDKNSIAALNKVLSKK